MSNQLAVIKKDIYAVRERFAEVAVDKSMTFERESGFALQILANSDYLTKIALDNKGSMLAAVVNVAAIGISLNPAKRQAYLVPRNGRVCLDISYMGLLDLAIQSGSIRWGQADLVHERDAFTLHGVDEKPEHLRQPFATDRGPVVGAYVVVKTIDGDYLTCSMSSADLLAIRDRSEAWARSKKGPWLTDEGEMMKKTVIKRAYKTWPKTDRHNRLDEAIQYLNTEGGEGLDLTKRESGGAPKDGALERLDEDQLIRVRELAEKVRKGYANLGPEAAAEYIAEQGLDADEYVGLWALFDATESTMRADIKKAQAAARFLV